MTKLFILFTLLSLCGYLQAQNVGIGTNTPHASAMLDVSSTTKGFLLPRMTIAQRNAVASPAKGLIVYDTDVNSIYHFNGSAWAALGGGGGLVLPYNGLVNNTTAAFAITNTSTTDGEAITGIASSTFTPAIEGTNQNTGGIGVRGISSHVSGYGVQGTTVSGSGVYGWSTGSGVGLRGLSASGYALLTSGNLRLAGGNTNPAAGAVLTSVDANGNAVWKPNSISFTAVNAVNEFITESVDRKIEFDIERHDLGNNFERFAGTVTTNSSVFTAPVSGVYHFSAGMRIIALSAVDNLTDVLIQIIKNGTIVAIGESAIQINSASSEAHPSVARDITLAAGDKVWIAIRQLNEGTLSAQAAKFAEPDRSWFSGHLVFAD